MQNHSDRRKSPRVPVSIKVEGKEGHKTVGSGYAVNLSEEGMAIEAQAMADGQLVPELGEQLYLRFKLPKSELVISVVGKIVRSEKSGVFPLIAVEFLSLAPDFHTEILRFVRTESLIA